VVEQIQYNDFYTREIKLYFLSYIYKFLVLIYFSCTVIEQIQYNDFYTREIKLYFLDFQALTRT